MNRSEGRVQTKNDCKDPTVLYVLTKMMYTMYMYMYICRDSGMQEWTNLDGH